MLNVIQQEYDKLPVAEQKLLAFWGKVFFCESSKLILLFLFFVICKKSLEFIFVTLVLMSIRCRLGGLHLKTYQGCLFATFCIYVCAIMLFPAVISLTPVMAVFLLTGSMVIFAGIGPVINPTRPALTKQQIQKAKALSLAVTLVYMPFAYLFYDNRYIICGTWIITIQALQLVAANLLRKRSLL